MGRLLLFIVRLENQGDQSDKEYAKRKNVRPCNFHIVHPLSFDWGQEVLPPEEGERTAYHGASHLNLYGSALAQSAIDRITHILSEVNSFCLFWHFEAPGDSHASVRAGSE